MRRPLPPRGGLTRDTLRAYLATDYLFGRGPHRRVLRIGMPAPRGIVSAVFITACNPFGEMLPEARNRREMARLGTWLRLHGYRWQPGAGQGRGRAGRAWRAEPSLLVPGVDAALATCWCVRWQQNAVVHVAADGSVSLLLHPELQRRSARPAQSASSSFRSASGSAAARQPVCISSAVRLP